MCKSTFIKVLSEKFSNVEWFADGGNSMVFKGLNIHTPIAIKVYSRLGDISRYVRFSEELKTISKLNGTEGVVPVLEVNLPEGPIICDKIKSLSDIAYMVMPLYPSSLAESFDKGMWNDDGTATVTCILAIAKVIKTIHEKGLAHRDLKPDNILVTEMGDFLVADFGLCIDLDNIVKRHTSGTELIGAINYRAPEFLRGRLDDSDHRPGDIFSLGRMLGAFILNSKLFNLTDLEFEKQITSIDTAKRKHHVLVDAIKGATHIDPVRRLNIDDLIKYLEFWMMEDKPNSTDAIVNKFLESEDVINQIANRNNAKEITALYLESINLIDKEFRAGIKPWLDVMAGLLAKGIGNAVEIDRINNIERLGLEELNILPDHGVSNTINMRASFNTGLASKIFLICSVYVYLNLNDIDDQQYAVVATYSLPAEKLEDVKRQLALPAKIKKFSYRDAAINSQILSDLREATDILNSLLLSQ